MSYIQCIESVELFSVAHKSDYQSATDWRADMYVQDDIKQTSSPSTTSTSTLVPRISKIRFAIMQAGRHPLWVADNFLRFSKTRST